MRPRPRISRVEQDLQAVRASRAKLRDAVVDLAKLLVQKGVVTLQEVRGALRDEMP